MLARMVMQGRVRYDRTIVDIFRELDMDKINPGPSLAQLSSLSGQQKDAFVLAARIAAERLLSRSQSGNDIGSDADYSLAVGMPLDFFDEIDNLVAEQLRASVDL